MLNDIPRKLLGSLLLYDLDLLYCYNLFDDRIYNLLVFLYIHSDDTIDMKCLYERPSTEKLYSDDQTMQAAMQLLSGNPHKRLEYFQ